VANKSEILSIQTCGGANFPTLSSPTISSSLGVEARRPNRRSRGCGGHRGARYHGDETNRGPGRWGDGAAVPSNPLKAQASQARRGGHLVIIIIIITTRVSLLRVSLLWRRV